MPSTIQHLVPVRPTVPKHARPVEGRAEERREDFRQLLDDAAAKPAEREAAKAGKSEGKKTAGKVEGTPGKAKSKNAAAGEIEQGVAEGDLAPTEAADGESAGGTTDVAGANVDSEDGEDAGGSDDEASAEEASGEEIAESAVVDPATVAGMTGAVGPTDGGAPIEGVREAGLDAVSAEKTGRPRVQALGSESPEDASEDGTGGEPAGEDTVLPEGVGAAAGSASTGGESGGPGAFGTEHAPAEPGVATNGKPGALAGSAKSGVSPLGAGPSAETGDATEQATPAVHGGGSDGGPIPAAASELPEFIGPPAPAEAGNTTAPVGGDRAAGLSPDAAATATSPQTPPQGAAAGPKVAAPAVPQPPEVQFAGSNHDSIVTGVKTQLMPHGGSMEIRLDPPELGALKVMVEMRDGTMTATFQTSNEEATRLLSHSLNQLKHVLEGQGVSVERLQVQQAPKSDSQSAGDDAKQQQQQQNWQDEHAARQEQQRKEMLRRMWRRVSGVADPIDVTA